MKLEKIVLGCIGLLEDREEGKQNQELIKSNLEWLLSIIFEINYSPEIEELYKEKGILRRVKRILESQVDPELEE